MKFDWSPTNLRTGGVVMRWPIKPALGLLLGAETSSPMTASTATHPPYSALSKRLLAKTARTRALCGLQTVPTLAFRPRTGDVFLAISGPGLWPDSAMHSFGL